ncbi:MAG: heavy metal translocating P-type ATPase [Ignavibacteria bacterium]|nr:heavy metal translocating P-type ATPase [Ignavibacteria bacterium]
MMKTPPHEVPTRETVAVVPGLCCPSEEQLIRAKLADKPEIRSCEINLVTKSVHLRHAGTESQILQWLKEIGLPGHISSSASPPPIRTNRALLYSTVGSGLFLLAGFIIDWTPVQSVPSAILFLLSALIGGWRIGVRAFLAVRNLSLEMNFLMTVAVIGAMTIDAYSEGAAVVLLFSISLLLESISVDRSRKAIHSLMKLSPSVASVRRGGKEHLLPVEHVEIGETIIVRPGERIPLDGVVIAGGSSIDESTLTGESVPVPKEVNDPVYAGTFNQRGSLEVRTTRMSADSTLARIIHLVEEAQGHKAPSQMFIERFAAYYSPAVFILAILVAAVPPVLLGQAFEPWFYRALVLLVIACPCALVISTPVSIVSAVTRGARHGVLIKGGKHLELLAQIRAIAFDKTGTLTKGEPEITDIIALDSMAPLELLKIGTALEDRSEHHLAAAFVNMARGHQVDFSRTAVDEFHAITGRGIEGFVDGKKYILGNHLLIEELGLFTPPVEAIFDQLERDGKTVTALATDERIVGIIALIDPPRDESARTVQELRQLGVRSIAMVTGDNKGTARAIAATLDIEDTRAELLPHQKLEAIRQLRKEHGPIAMVGDGVNDAPALAGSDIGIAVGGVASDTAIETSDVVLMSDDLSKIPQAIRLGRRTQTIIRQNIALALATKAAFLLLGVLGLTSLWLAILADDGATLVVIANSLRLLRS